MADPRRSRGMRIECRTVEGRTVWVKRDVIGIAMVSERREDIDPDVSAPLGLSGGNGVR